MITKYWNFVFGFSIGFDSYRHNVNGRYSFSYFVIAVIWLSKWASFKTVENMMRNRSRTFPRVGMVTFEERRSSLSRVGNMSQWGSRRTIGHLDAKLNMTHDDSIKIVPVSYDATAEKIEKFFNRRRQWHWNWNDISSDLLINAVILMFSQQPLSGLSLNR